MALPKDMRLKGHRTFNYIHQNSTKYYGKLMTFKVAISNPEILLTHKLRYTSDNFRMAIAISKENYAIVLKVFNPKKSGLYQFHSYGQPRGESVSSYLGSWTIVID